MKVNVNKDKESWSRENMNNTNEAYSEILAFLEIIDEKYVKKIPKKLIEFFVNKKSDTYFPKYTLDIPIEEQKFLKETRELIALLYLNYWYETEEERAELERMYAQNTLKNEQELREKYNPDNIFKSKIKNEMVTEKEEVQLVEYKETLFKRILKKIKSFFKK
jgi:hypothetical protein